MTRAREYLLSIGSNVEPARWVPRALGLLRARFEVRSVSPAYDVAAVGGGDQPRFINLAVRIRTDLPPPALHAACRHVEALCARRRSSDRFAPRTLDLDVVRVGAAGAEPQADLLDEPYVLVPCAEVWPEATVGPAGRTLAEEAAERFPGWAEGRRVLEDL